MEKTQPVENEGYLSSGVLHHSGLAWLIMDAGQTLQKGAEDSCSNVSFQTREADFLGMWNLSLFIVHSVKASCSLRILGLRILSLKIIACLLLELWI